MKSTHRLVVGEQIERIERSCGGAGLVIFAAAALCDGLQQLVLLAQARYLPA
jgi:hypothetical protein